MLARIGLGKSSVESGRILYNIVL